MTRALVRLFIERRFVPVDGKRRAIADGHVERQDEGASTSGYALLGELGAALDETEGRDG